jgi:hypothetical protein
MYFVLCSVALLSAAGDLRMLSRGGLFGTQRITRHLWRMCFAWFIASGSVFLARPHLFPAILRETYALVFLGFLPLLLLIFWLFRVRFANPFRRKQPLPTAASESTKRPLAAPFLQKSAKKTETTPRNQPERRFVFPNP